MVVLILDWLELGGEYLQELFANIQRGWTEGRGPGHNFSLQHEVLSHDDGKVFLITCKLPHLGI